MKIGVDMGGTNIRVGLVKNSTIIKKVEAPTLAERSENEIVDDLRTTIRKVFSSEVTSIGIGVPSVVDVEKGIVYNVANIASWKEVHLKEILEKEFKVPVIVDNDANCFALGEHTFGEGKPYSDVVCIAIGTGVGAGLIFNGQIYRGANTGSGEIGSFPYLDDQFEYYCSGQFFLQEHKVKGSQVAKRAAEGDKDALELFNIFGKHLGNLFKAVLFAYDPQAIVIGGSIAKSYPLYKDEMLKVLHTFPYPATTDKLEIHLSNIEDIGILGASELS